MEAVRKHCGNGAETVRIHPLGKDEISPELTWGGAEALLETFWNRNFRRRWAASGITCGTRADARAERLWVRSGKSLTFRFHGSPPGKALGGCGISNLNTVRNPCGTVYWGRFRTLSSNFSAPFPGSASGSASGSPSGSRSLGAAPRANPEGTQKRLQGALLEAAQAFLRGCFLCFIDSLNR